MDQNSGDGEPNTDSSQQCKQKYGKEETAGFVMPGDSPASATTSTPIQGSLPTTRAGNKVSIKVHING